MSWIRYGSFKYSPQSNNAVVFGDTKNGKSCGNAIFSTFDENVTIPSDFMENNTKYSVAAIYANALCGNSEIKSLSIPSTVKSIGDAAFTACINLHDVCFGEGSVLVSIGTRAFEFCYSLEKFTLPPSVTSIGLRAFGEYVSLSEFVYCGSSDFSNINIISTKALNITAPKIFVLMGIYKGKKFGTHDVIFTSLCVSNKTIKGIFKTCKHTSFLGRFSIVFQPLLLLIS